MLNEEQVIMLSLFSWFHSTPAMWKSPKRFVKSRSLKMKNPDEM